MRITAVCIISEKQRHRSAGLSHRLISAIVFNCLDCRKLFSCYIHTTGSNQINLSVVSGTGWFVTDLVGNPEYTGFHDFSFSYIRGGIKKFIH